MKLSAQYKLKGLLLLVLSAGFGALTWFILESMGAAAAGLLFVTLPLGMGSFAVAMQYIFCNCVLDDVQAEEDALDIERAQKLYQQNQAVTD